MDTVQRKLTLPDSHVLKIEHCAHRIDETIEPGQGISAELIESEIPGWIEMGEYQSEDKSGAQVRESERDVRRWNKIIDARRRLSR